MQSIRRLEGTTQLQVERRGNGRVNHYRLGAESGGETRPVGESNRSENPAPGGGKGQPEAVEESNRNQTDPWNQTNNKARRKKPTPPDPRVRQFVDWWATEFQRVRGVAYVV